jgi:hypothetical protein
MTTIQKRKDEEGLDTQPDDGQEPEEEKEPERKPISPKEEKALFEGYELAHQKFVVAEQALATAKATVGAAVKAIYDALGKGPFGWKGRELTVAKSAKGEGLYFRGEKKREVKRIG